MAEPNQPQIKLPEIEQVSVLAWDLQKSMESLWNTFGIGPWAVYVFEPSALTEMTYRGREGRFGMQTARAKWGITEIELIQPLEGENIYTDFLKEHGETVHHLGWFKVENMAETIEQMEKLGFPCLMSGRTYRARFAYFDTTKVLGTILESVSIDPSVPLKEADRVWPE
jgi:methylmalonyl-CoA/ethylmalonyl-CoA epimerase